MKARTDLKLSAARAVYARRVGELNTEKATEHELDHEADLAYRAGEAFARRAPADVVAGMDHDDDLDVVDELRADERRRNEGRFLELADRAFPVVFAPTGLPPSSAGLPFVGTGTADMPPDPMRTSYGSPVPVGSGQYDSQGGSDPDGIGNGRG